MLAWLLKTILVVLLLPPGNGLALLALAAFKRKRRWAFGVALAGGLLLFLQSLPLVGTALMGTLEKRAGAWSPDPAGAQAIVVLGSGLIRPAAEFGGETASDRTLIRIRRGAQLARETNLPLLVSGGRPLNAEHAEAVVMADILEQEFGVAVRWQEDESMDTAGNARLSAAMLGQDEVRRILLVTQAFHMPRARMLFEAQGFEVIPAPTHFVALNGGDFEALSLLPSAAALHNSYYALHEWLGIAWVYLSGA
jgi:uncharacterized SAM-binding protein YcdF (DUF218 family)